MSVQEVEARLSDDNFRVRHHRQDVSSDLKKHKNCQRTIFFTKAVRLNDTRLQLFAQTISRKNHLGKFNTS